MLVATDFPMLRGTIETFRATIAARMFGPNNYFSRYFSAVTLIFLFISDLFVR